MNTPATYAVYLKRRAERELRNLPQNIRTRVDVRLAALANNPRPQESLNFQAKQILIGESGSGSTEFSIK